MAFPDTHLPAASTWFTGFIGAPLIQTNVTDPLNALADRVAAVATARTGRRSTTITLASGDNLVGTYPDTGGINIGDIDYAAGVFTINTGGFYGWLATCGISSGSGRVSMKLKFNTTDTFIGQQDVILDSALGQTKSVFGGPASYPAGTTFQLNLLASSAAAGATVTPYEFGIVRFG